MTNQSGSRLRATRSIAIPLALVLTFMLASAVIAQAQQPATSLQGLQSKLSLSDNLRVVDENGKVTNGSFGSITGSSLRLIVKNKPREFPENSILRVEKITHDRLRNGILIGGGIGAGLAFGGTLAGNSLTGAYACDYGSCFIAIPFGFGLGALVGGIVDGSIKHKETIFQSPQKSVYRLNVAPLVSKQKKGLALSYAF